MHRTRAIRIRKLRHWLGPIPFPKIYHEFGDPLLLDRHTDAMIGIHGANVAAVPHQPEQTYSPEADMSCFSDRSALAPFIRCNQDWEQDIDQ